MAVHTIFGFAATIPSPIVFGYLLDLGGGEREHGAWILAFGVLSFGAALGPVLLRRFTGRPVALTGSA